MEERKRLKRAQEQQNVLYEYVITDSDTSIDEINKLRLGNSTITQDFSSSTYSNMIFFHIKGKKHVVVVENHETLLIVNLSKRKDNKKEKVTEVDVPPCGASSKIVGL
jgi:hypothetical protein